MDNGLDDKGGDAFIHPFDSGSGDKRQAVDEGGVIGVHIGASGDKDDEVVNNGIGRFVERAKIIIKYIDDDVFLKMNTDIERLIEPVFVVVLIITMELYDSWRQPKRPIF